MVRIIGTGVFIKGALWATYVRHLVGGGGVTIGQILSDMVMHVYNPTT